MRRTWTWHFDLPPDRLWPVLADTSRFNEAMGLPPYVLEETPQPNGTVLRRGSGKAAGFALAWEEKPYEWIANRHFRQARLFTKGPFRRFGPVFDIEPAGSGSKVSYALEWEPLTFVGRLFGRKLAEQAGTAVEKRVLQAVAFASGERPTMFDMPAPELPPGARERAAALATTIDSSPYGNGLGKRLSDYVLGGMASDLAHLKPKLLAREFGVAQRSAIEACLAAVSAGLLSMQWDLLCTNCRGPKLSAVSLAELPRGAHCPSCNIDYDRDFERNVELAFTPAPAIRPLMAGGYCLSGPMATPHVPVQLLLAPGERRTIDIALPPGRYRMRTLHPGAVADIDHDGGAFPGLRATATGVEATAAGEAGRISFGNDADFELAALIEDRTWTRDVLTATEVISLQVFRDLFAEATLRPGDDAAVGQIALLFTDLRGSTALYERVGDAVAFNIVREHFAFLGSIVRDHNGAVVKTIGDAVMASFGDPADAVRAALAMQARIAEFNRANAAERALAIKLGIHVGSSVMVSLNDRLDYFGSTVNMAARLQGQSTGGDIVLSRAVADDPAVKPLLESVPTRDESVSLKGFDRPVGFVRVLPRES
ncbi:adenylate/guanylate cyclase domain-containing protein [Reyranella sp.]|uniref:adenylate/guanylate cyclase domain-containing protein n=1 Tax=Reyranella sp. TaxID=1929291 RepID=UPI003D0FFBAA